jgi:hypothetical protein
MIWSGADLTWANLTWGRFDLLPEMTASTDYVPLLVNYFPLFVMIGDNS